MRECGRSQETVSDTFLRPPSPSSSSPLSKRDRTLAGNASHPTDGGQPCIYPLMCSRAGSRSGRPGGAHRGRPHSGHRSPGECATMYPQCTQRPCAARVLRRIHRKAHQGNPTMPIYNMTLATNGIQDTPTGRTRVSQGCRAVLGRVVSRSPLCTSSICTRYVLRS